MPDSDAGDAGPPGTCPHSVMSAARRTFRVTNPPLTAHTHIPPVIRLRLYQPDGMLSGQEPSSLKSQGGTVDMCEWLHPRRPAWPVRFDAARRFGIGGAHECPAKDSRSLLFKPVAEDE